MRTNTRRKFIRNTSLTASGLVLSSVLKAKNQSVITSAIGCAPSKTMSLYGTVSSRKSGKWSDPDTWGGKVPAVSDTPLISSGHTVVYDLETSVISGLNVDNNAILQFEPSQSATLQSTKNIVVQGQLEMTPSKAANTHLVQFINIDESKVVGGGHIVLETDIGLWVMGSGKLNLIGSSKKSWTNLQGSAMGGTTSITLKEAPAGWMVDDEVVVCPTQSIAGLGRTKTVPLFERFQIKSLAGNSANLSGSLSLDHLKVEPAGSGKLWTAEVLNLHRNVKIEGTPTGKTHVFIKSNVPQTLKNVALRHMGPKTEDSGRYALHFHHCFNGSKGTLVQDCVAYDTGSHCFVPHTSHGITFKNCVAFNFLLEAYWWDERHVTHSTKYDGCVAALGSGRGFLLGIGDDNSCNNCVAVSAAIGRGEGSPNNSGGFFWEADNEGVWEFKNNLSHSNYNGLRVWQNTHKNHVIENYCSYNNMIAAFHGAYMNCYTYKGGYHYNSLFKGKATSANTSGARFENITFDAAGNAHALEYSDSPIASAGEQTNKFYNCTFKNFTTAPILFEASKPAEADGTASVARTIKRYDIIQCDLGGKLPEIHPDVENGTVIRIQPKTGQSIKIEKTGPYDSSNGKLVTSNIAAFTATIWGKGDGLTGEYYNATTQFESSKKVFTRIDSNIAFNEWAAANVEEARMFHHKLTDEQYCVRWSGKLMAQYSEEYMFRCNTAGGVKLTVNGKLIIDQWDAEPFNVNDRFAIMSVPVKLVAGKSYDILLEHCNRSRYRGCLLHWKSTSMTHFEIVPQCQLYPSSAPVPPVEEPVENKAPVAKAGEDITITLPAKSVTLDGTPSVDPDGKIASYKWTKKSGPDKFSIAKAAAAVTTVTGLIEGEYVFQLAITDDKGAVSTDDVKITVQPEVKTTEPVAKAGNDATLQLPNNKFTLDASGSTAPGSKITSYKWTKLSGPSQYTIANAAAVSTSVSNLVEGTYVFQLLITDDKGNTAKDSITITVNAEAVNQPPVAIAGDNIELTLPTDKATLNAFASTDADGRIVSYKWSKVNGPARFSIASPAAASTVISGLVEGEYVFRLEVKDDKGATATDEVKVLVNAKKPDVKPPKANAGNNIEIELPTNNVKMKGNGSAGTGGAIVTYKWSKISGPDKYKIVNPNAASTVINQLTEGIYVFQLQVKDESGAQSTDDVVVTVVSKNKGEDDSAAGSNPPLSDLQVNVSPNPSTSVFRVNLKSNSDKPITLRLFDRWGKEVGVIKNVKSGASITIPGDLKRGTYFGVAEQGFQKKTMTLIKM